MLHRPALTTAGKLQVPEPGKNASSTVHDVVEVSLIGKIEGKRVTVMIGTERLRDRQEITQQSPEMTSVPIYPVSIMPKIEGKCCAVSEKNSLPCGASDAMTITNLVGYAVRVATAVNHDQV